MNRFFDLEEIKASRKKSIETSDKLYNDLKIFKTEKNQVLKKF